MNSMYCQIITIPNVLSLLRLMLAPLIAYLIIVGSFGLALIIFFMCAISDVLDGLIARRFGQESFVGACLDPVADKSLSIVSFYAFAISSFSAIAVPSWFIILITIKEFILVLGTLFFCFGANNLVKINPSVFGKMAALFQVQMLFWMLVASYFQLQLAVNNGIFMWLAFMSTFALIEYFVRALDLLRKGAV